ncbi:MAG: family 10 glycosylhydrolase, partial [Verrucomicrobia bacterium]|nr:family 10 glycosylhydrolase [Verrucomicrobiota bacterium]
TVNYPSKIGHRWGEGRRRDDAITDAHRGVYESLETLISKGIIPPRVIEEHVHQMGLKFHAMFRLALVGDLPPSDLFGEGLVRRRPDLRMLAQDGTPMEKASYAFPEVRDYMLALIREGAETFNIDGVNLGFVRGPQWVGYEKIVVEDFKKEHGKDPRHLDPNDANVQRHRAGYINTFVRDARRLVDDIGRKQGKKIELSAWLGYNGSLEFHIFYGLDMETWLREGLLDSIIVNGDATLIKTIKSYNCRVITGVGGGSPQEYVSSALRGYEAGADGFTAWDMNVWQERPEFWEVLRRVGHRNEMDAFAKSPPEPTCMSLKTVGGLDICHVTNQGAKERKYWPPDMLPMYSGG